MQIKFLLNGKEINLTGDNVIIKSKNFNVDKNGNMSCKNADISGTITSNNATISGGKFFINTTRALGDIVFKVTNDVGNRSWVGSNNALIGGTSDEIDTGVYLQGRANGQSMVMADVLSQTSLEESKKNFEQMKNGLDIIKSTEIYKYNLKSQADGDKKHIGFVIVKEYKYSNEITSLDEEGKEVGVDTYSMISVAYKAIQEQQEIIEQLQEKIKELEEMKNE